MRTGLFLILMFIGSLLLAQSYNFELISRDDGLPSNRTSRSLIDSKGYMWFATPRGVARYDGHNMKVFNTIHGLATNSIWNIWEDSEGRIWLYSFAKKVQYIENDSVVTAFKKTTIKTNDNFHEENGAIYTIDTKFIYKYENGTSSKRKLDLLKSERLTFLLTKEFVLTYNKKDSVRTIVSISGNKERISYHRDSTPAMSGSPGKYIANENYVYSFSPNNRIVRWNWHTNEAKYFDLAGICKHGKKDGIIFFSGKNVQVSSKVGMVIFDKNLKELERYLTPKRTKFSGLIIKDKGVIFQPALKEGVYYSTVQKKDCLYFEAFSNGYSYHLGPGLAGELLIGNTDGAVFELKKNEISKIFDKSWNSNFIGKELVIAGILNNTYFKDEISSYSENFSKLKTDNLFKVSSKKGSTQNLMAKVLGKFSQDKIEIKKMIGIRRNPKLGWLSISTMNAIFILKEKKGGLTDIQKIKQYKQWRTAITNDSTVWSGGFTGLSRLDGDSLINLEKEHELYSKEIHRILVDKNQNIWVSTHGFGIFSYRKGQPPIAVQGCESDVVIHMVFSPSGDLWASTSTGVKQIRITYKPTLSAKVIDTYTMHDGLPTTTPIRIFVTDSLLYATDGGVLAALQINKKREIIKPKLYLTNYTVNNHPSNLDLLSSLTYEENDISIGYSGVSLASKRGLTYHYYITNYTNDTLVTKENEIYLNNISSGNYKMTLFAQDDVGNRSETKEISFSIGKPWYLQWWAFLIYFGMFSVITYLFSAFRINKIRKTETTKKRISELELQALQSQLNPHFIFNALGAIQYYQNEQDVAEAEEYLGNFARLMRLYLESSKKAVVPLKDELELIQLYIGLEKLRFEDKFSVEIDIEKQLEFEHINIPSMVLQPFVENAINHGLFHKKEPGHLSIKIKKQDDQWIHVIVKDDGIGREAAQKIAKKSYKNYKSRAMQIIEERLSIMNKGDDTDVKIVIKDLLEDGKPAGTEVDILLPLV